MCKQQNSPRVIVSTKQSEQRSCKTGEAIKWHHKVDSIIKANRITFISIFHLGFWDKGFFYCQIIPIPCFFPFIAHIKCTIHKYMTMYLFHLVCIVVVATSNVLCRWKSQFLYSVWCDSYDGWHLLHFI